MRPIARLTPAARIDPSGCAPFPHLQEDGHGVREPGLSAGEVADILGVDPAWVTARIDGGELRATKPSGRLSGRPMVERYRILERSLRVFLMGHAHELDASGVDLPRLIGIMAGRSRKSGASPNRRQGQAGADPGPAAYRRWSGEERARLRALVETRTITRPRPSWAGASPRCASRPAVWA